MRRCGGAAGHVPFRVAAVRDPEPITADASGWARRPSHPIFHRGVYGFRAPLRGPGMTVVLPSRLILRAMGCAVVTRAAIVQNLRFAAAEPAPPRRAGPGRPRNRPGGDPLEGAGRAGPARRRSGRSSGTPRRFRSGACNPPRIARPGSGRRRREAGQGAEQHDLVDEIDRQAVPPAQDEGAPEAAAPPARERAGVPHQAPAGRDAEEDQPEPGEDRDVVVRGRILRAEAEPFERRAVEDRRREEPRCGEDERRDRQVTAAGRAGTAGRGRCRRRCSAGCRRR